MACVQGGDCAAQLPEGQDECQTDLALEFDAKGLLWLVPQWRPPPDDWHTPHARGAVGREVQSWQEQRFENACL
eukprot:4713125-Pyramimonas_sp.AAC.1